MENGLEDFDTGMEPSPGQMELNMTETGSMGRPMERAPSLMSTGTATLETGCMIKPMDLANTLTRMERLMKASGKTIYRMAKELRNGEMGPSMMDST